MLSSSMGPATVSLRRGGQFNSPHWSYGTCMFGPSTGATRPALSMEPFCLGFGSTDSKVVNRPRKGYVPKVLSTLFRMQVIALSPLPLAVNKQAPQAPHPLYILSTLADFSNESSCLSASKAGFPDDLQFSELIVGSTPLEVWPPLRRGPVEPLS